MDSDRVGSRVAECVSRIIGGKRPGFTLVEVLVTAAVLAIGISAGVRALGAMTQASALAADRSTAVRLAGERLALLEAKADTEAADAEGDFETEPRFHWRQEVSSGGEEGVLEVTLTVIWHDGTAERRYDVTTYVPDRTNQDAGAPSQEP